MIRYTIFLTIIGYACCAVVNTDPKWETKLNLKKMNLEETYLDLLERDLMQDGWDFLELIDFEELVTIGLNYLEDEEVMNLVMFILGPEFKEMLMEFESMAEFREAVTHLASTGYDPTPAINLIHNILSLPPYQTRTTAGINGMIEQIINSLPIERIKDLFQDKLLSSPQFSELYQVLTSEEFVDILRRMSDNEIFVRTRSRLEDMGFDFERIGDMINGIL